MLSAQGFEVLLPLAPGHGRLRQGTQDDTRALPSFSTVPYERFVTDMNALMSEVRTPAGSVRVIGGLSLGGALATMAVQQQPSLYDRALIAAPFYESGNFWITAVARASERLRSTALRDVTETAWRAAGEIELGWGEPCELERRGGRAGICQFQVKHFASIVRLGANVLDAVRPGRTRIQWIGVEEDQAASNGAIRRAYGAYGAGAGLCFYRSPASHSLFSRFDNPMQDKFWLPSLLESATEFVVVGRSFETDGPSTEPSTLRCALRVR
jgi:pimeloyl-ACP methyl ester carboxylesterase